MKTILFLLLFLPSTAQNKIWDVNRIEKTTKIYMKGAVFCYFYTQVDSKCVEVRIKAENKPIISSLFFETKNGNFEIKIDRVRVTGFHVGDIFLRRLDQWKSIDSGIKVIKFMTNDMKWHEILINSNLTKLKNYAQ